MSYYRERYFIERYNTLSNILFAITYVLDKGTVVSVSWWMLSFCIVYHMYFAKFKLGVSFGNLL